MNRGKNLSPQAGSLADYFALHRAGRLLEAESGYRKILKSQPRQFDALQLLALVLADRGAHQEADGYYVAALKIAQPPNVVRNYSRTLFALGRYAEVIPLIRYVLEHEPLNISDLHILWQSHYLLDDYSVCLPLVEQYYSMRPDDWGAKNALYVCRLLYGVDTAELERSNPPLVQPGKMHRYGSPGLLPYRVTEGRLLLDLTREWRQKVGFAENPRPSPRPRRERPRVGFFSSDFRSHPTTTLSQKMFEQFDPARLDVHLILHSIPDSEPYSSIRDVPGRFHDLASLDDQKLEDYVRKLDLDLLIDLNGLTTGHRFWVLNRRPAPLMANWLGFAGTMGSACYDYIIADPILVPPEYEAFYSEKVVRLPGSYQPSSPEREVAATLSRQEWGLPANAVVLCSFNRAAKITTEIFASWMQLLRDLPQTVLWLFDSPAGSGANFKARAAEAGIDPGRIVLAPKVSLPEHLARYEAADIAIDTYPYGSHTTASDAIWMGCPFVGFHGETFASRVSLSLLTVAGLKQFSAGDAQSYRTLISELATNPAHRAAARASFKEARTSRLFNIVSFSQGMTAAIEGMVRRSWDGLPSQSFAIEDEPTSS